MWVVWTLDIVSLCIGAVAALVMFFYPPRINAVAEKGEPAVTFVVPPTPESVAAAKRYTRLARLGPLLLLIGFLMQLVRAILAACVGSHTGPG